MTDIADLVLKGMTEVKPVAVSFWKRWSDDRKSKRVTEVLARTAAVVLAAANHKTSFTKLGLLVAPSRCSQLTRSVLHSAAEFYGWLQDVGGAGKTIYVYGYGGSKKPSHTEVSRYLYEAPAGDLTRYWDSHEWSPGVVAEAARRMQQLVDGEAPYDRYALLAAYVRQARQAVCFADDGVVVPALLALFVIPRLSAEPDKYFPPPPGAPQWHERHELTFGAVFRGMIKGEDWVWRDFNEVRRKVAAAELRGSALVWLAAVAVTKTPAAFVGAVMAAASIDKSQEVCRSVWSRQWRLVSRHSSSGPTGLYPVSLGDKLAPCFVADAAWLMMRCVDEKKPFKLCCSTEDAVGNYVFIDPPDDTKV